MVSNLDNYGFFVRGNIFSLPPFVTHFLAEKPSFLVYFLKKYVLLAHFLFILR